MKTIILDEMQEKQSHTLFRKHFTPVKMWARFYFRSMTGVILDGVYRFSKDDARDFCTKANKIMDEVEKLRSILFKLLIAYRVVTKETDKKRFEDKMNAKEQEMEKLFLQIHSL